jgi:serine acetyltransferase
VIAAGSVVENDVPAGAIVSGAPARVLRLRRPSEMPAPPASAVTVIDGTPLPRVGGFHAAS